MALVSVTTRPAFEYLMIDMGKTGQDPSTYINGLGAVGWELCGVTVNIYVFKRQSGTISV